MGLFKSASSTNFEKDKTEFSNLSFDIIEFTALIYLLSILGFAIFILIYFVTKTHEALMQGTWVDRRNPRSNSVGIK